MKKKAILTIAVCALAMVCLLAGCKKNEPLPSTFPLKEDAIISALEETGLSGKISESETESYSDRHIAYVVRSETETYGDSDNGVMVASVSSAATDDGRVLFTVFDRINVEQFSWEDWKEQIRFATILFGGFGEENAVYQAFCEKELPGNQPHEWDEQLPGGYCRMIFIPRSQKILDEKGFEVWLQSAYLRVNIYETYELYQKLGAK